MIIEHKIQLTILSILYIKIQNQDPGMYTEIKSYVIRLHIITWEGMNQEYLIQW